MALSPHLQKLVEEARRKQAEKQAAAASPQKSNNSAGLSRVQAPLHLKPTVQTSHAGSVLTASSTFQSITGVPLNEKQLQAVELAMRGQSFNLCGAAGTGKTTATREVISQLVRLPHVGQLENSTKHLNRGESSVVIISFTNKAVNNIKKFLPPDLKRHCLTYHKLLEYKPAKSFDEMELAALGLSGIDPKTGDSKKTGMFLPSYNKIYKLPHISTVIVEESSMVGTDLHQKLLDALPNPERTQFIFLGDLNQLPPIFGPSILGFSLLERSTVELTHVYRQALESPIITLAHQIREGRGFIDRFQKSGRLTEEGYTDDRGEHGKVVIRPWKKKLESYAATKTMLKAFLIPLVSSPSYDFENSVILCPFNKSFGTVDLNLGLADALGKQRGAEVWEVVARYQKSYWAVDDRVLVDRREAIITKIAPTPGYDGPITELPSTEMDRWGRIPGKQQAHPTATEEEIKRLQNEKAEDILASLVVGGDGEGTKNLASHTITVQFLDDGASLELSSAGAINAMQFSYVLTIHKSQGSEWKKVYLLLHYSHNTMISRELLYTAITRARQELTIICEPDRGIGPKHIVNTLTRGASNPEIKGVTLQEKAAYFQAKKRSMV